MHPESGIDTMQNIKFKTCIINGQERYAFTTIDETSQMTEMPAQMFPESLLSLQQLSEQYSDDVILLCCVGAAWHKSGGLNLPNNIVLFYIPPYTPEMNPIEQIWKELRNRGFHNQVFATLEKVVERLCDTICSLSNQVISSISGRDWIIKAFN